MERLERERYEEEEDNGYVFRLYELEQVFDSYQGHDSAPQPSTYDSSFDSGASSDSDMTDEQLAMHQKEIAETDGFDVKRMPGVRDFGVISPFDLSNNEKMAEVEFFAKMAIDEFNKRFKVSEGELVFDKVIMAMGQAANGIRHYITFDAKNLAQEGKIFTYQAIVAGVFEDEVNAFRLKPEPGCCHHHDNDDKEKDREDDDDDGTGADEDDDDDGTDADEDDSDDDCKRKNDD